MSIKRRDNKNRILNTGESQRKDGRYVYKYTDNLGKPQFIYAWKLVPTDKTPKGKFFAKFPQIRSAAAPHFCPPAPCKRRKTGGNAPAVLLQ